MEKPEMEKSEMPTPEMQAPSLMARRLDRMTQSVALIGFAGLVIMALLIFYDGAARWLNAPRIHGFRDYGEIIYPLVIAGCFPAGLLRQTNVAMRIFGTLGGRRVNAALEAFAAFIVLLFFAVLAWQFIKLTGQYAQAGRTTRTIGIALAPYWWGVSAIMAVCVPVQIYVFISWMRAALANATPAHYGLADAERDATDAPAALTATEENVNTLNTPNTPKENNASNENFDLPNENLDTPSANKK